MKSFLSDSLRLWLKVKMEISNSHWEIRLCSCSLWIKYVFAQCESLLWIEHVFVSLSLCVPNMSLCFVPVYVCRCGTRLFFVPVYVCMYGTRLCVLSRCVSLRGEPLYTFVRGYISGSWLGLCVFLSVCFLLLMHFWTIASVCSLLFIFLLRMHMIVRWLLWRETMTKHTNYFT